VRSSSACRGIFHPHADEFLENIALVSDQDTIREGNVPTLLTLHAAKGLEFGVVFIVGLDDGILPHSRSFDEPEQWRRNAVSSMSASRAPRINFISSAPFNAADAAQARRPILRASWMMSLRTCWVEHPTWGEGIVLDSRLQDDDEIVDVVFNSVGIKRLSASLANLKII
jgi:DNA helicase II / ATP-dependent DNA helicase PcrA